MIIGVQASKSVVEPVPCIYLLVLADCVVGLIEIEFLRLTIISVTRHHKPSGRLDHWGDLSSGIAIANGVDGNAVRKEGVGVQASDSVVEPVTCIHLLCTRRLRRWPS